jgi:hypothetical protein
MMAIKPMQPNPEDPSQESTATDPAVSLWLARIGWVCMAAFAMAAVATVLFFGWWMLKDRVVFGHERFEQVRWMTAERDTRNCARGDMAYDVQQNLLKPGLMRDEVTVLLGCPTWEDGDQLEYDLGSCMHVIHGLRLYFDARGQLMHSRIVQH